jgi:hypothetical protein
MTSPGNVWFLLIRGVMPGMLLVAAVAMVGAGDLPCQDGGLEDYNVIWDSPSDDSSGSMPLGNGDLGVNAWVEPSGDLVLLLSKSDAWSENCRLLKLGRVRIQLDPNPWGDDGRFEQQLRLKQGEMTVHFGQGDGATQLRVWVDAHHPVVRIEAESDMPRQLLVSLEVWRTAERELQGQESHSVYGLHGGPEPIICYPDSVLPDQTDRLVWYHRNERSIWADNLRYQGLEGLIERLEDPLLYRTFGGLIEGDGLRNVGDQQLRSDHPQDRFALNIHLHTAQTPNVAGWLAQLETQAAASRQEPLEEARVAHREWWKQFWDRSWIYLSGGSTRPSLPDRLVHPVVLGRDQAGRHRFSGEIGRVSLLERAATGDEIAGWAADSKETLRDLPGLLGSWAQPEPGIELLAADRMRPDRSWTVEAWVRPNALPGSGARIVDSVTPGGPDGFLLDTHPGNSLRLVVGREQLRVPEALPAQRWTHVAAVVDQIDGTQRLFVNGKEVQPPSDAEPQPSSDTHIVARGYQLQRWINACAGRGVHPIKFNGSLFTVDMAGFDPDYRRWGGPYWWQNTRLPYWPMLASGDFDLMPPLFRLYESTLPLAEYRTQVWFEHEGAFFPETMYFWGMYVNANYGWNRGDLPVGELTNRFIRREYTASPELMAMMWDYYQYTGDAQFLQDHLLPMSQPLLTFWDQHYQRNDEGQLILYPAQALETLQDAKNPATDIAGLDWVLGKLLDLPEPLTSAAQRKFWTQLRQALPPLPMTGDQGEQRVLGAEESFSGRGNSENPELYAVFPFRRYGVGKPELDIGRRTFQHRVARGNTGWSQDDTQAAYLGLTDEAARLLVGRAKRKHPGSRFPAFWGPNHDWVPDQDHGGNLMKALQRMLLQAEGDQIWLFPAWPADWNVSFKLHAPHQTTIQGLYQDGQLKQLKVTPASRRSDVQVMLDGIDACRS